jgi:SOS-response transcriptional repressor LexA
VKRRLPAKHLSLDVRADALRQYLVEYFDEYGYAPSIREICAHELFYSTSHAAYVLDRLVERGDIHRGTGARAIDIRPALARRGHHQGDPSCGS